MLAGGVGDYRDLGRAPWPDSCSYDFRSLCRSSRQRQCILAMVPIKTTQPTPGVKLYLLIFFIQFVFATASIFGLSWGPRGALAWPIMEPCFTSWRKGVAGCKLKVSLNQ
jgi:hypothetical protein